MFSFGSSHPIARCVRTGTSVLVPVPVPREQAFYVCRFEGRCFGVRNSLDYRNATVELGAERDDLGPEFRTWLAEYVQRAKLV